MKKILVLTDLGSTAAHAASAALPLCCALHANLVLLHTWTPQPALEAYPNNSWGIDNLLYGEQSKGQLEALKENLQEELVAMPATERLPSIEWRHEDGSLTDCLQLHLHHKDIELIVMGSRRGGRLDHLFLGSDTRAVIDHSNRPVLVFPEDKKAGPIKKVTFASDLNEGDLRAVHYLTRIGRLLGFELEIIHVMLYGSQEDDAALRQEEFKKMIDKFRFPNISYHNIYGRDITGRLNRHCLENKSDLLVLCHDQHSFWGRLFGNSQSIKLLKKQELPVLVIPAYLETGGL
ncbi:universal stress protein [Mucilaginibacter sp. HC2]|jgi:nucleotide-binding universal stress UspA family protein|uniref:universal stress protein n=1 Tax=Mucilaginibacter inviolabilis TaxID=2714892 RepID=UPI00140C9C5B|nr:universal stress protein [Mucilaginibacter inviolabilis]NHA02597.1 universal stress protein [Mucilaginibacter inviolabilis]